MTHHPANHDRATLPSLRVRRRAAWLLRLGAAILSASCSDTSPLVAPVERAKPVTALTGESPLADTLARALALAMADPKVREQVRDDLRDAPTKRHAIHLRSYLRGARGRILAAAAGRQIGRSVDQFLALEAQLPVLEMVMPRPMDRTTWEATPDILVFGTSAGLADRYKAGERELGFRTTGESDFVSVWTHSLQPYIAIRPTTSDFGGDPEAERAKAPKRARSTVTDRKEEYLAATLDCSLAPSSDCVPVSGRTAASMTTSIGVFLPSHMTWAYCRSTTQWNDVDRDGITDECEDPLARAFAPTLWESATDDAIGKEPFYSVSPYPYALGKIQIIYALSYYRDAGDPLTRSYAHDGDSEFIIVEVVPIGDNFTTNFAVDYVFLSAHWDTEVESSQRVHYSNLWFNNDVHRASAEVWVAEDKHANYRSRAACENGGWSPFGLSADECDDLYYKKPLVDWYPWRGNLGSQYHAANPMPDMQMQNCVSALVYDPPDVSPRVGTECYWNVGARFAGWVGNITWQDYDHLSTPYQKIVSSFYF